MHNVHAAKTHLSTLLETAERGEEVIIARSGKPIARLVAITDAGLPRLFGALKGKISVSGDFDEAVDPETWGL
jgi:prevent-host-death family protein